MGQLFLSGRWRTAGASLTDLTWLALLLLHQLQYLHRVAAQQPNDEQ